MATIATPARAWAQEGPELLSREEQAEWRRYVIAVSYFILTAAAGTANIRSLAFQKRAQPGTLQPQARFTLLPVPALRPAFLQLSQDTIGALVNKVVDTHIPILRARVKDARPRRRADLAALQPLFANVTGAAEWFDATLAQGAAADGLTRNHYRYLNYYIDVGNQQREALKSALQQGQSNTAWWAAYSTSTPGGGVEEGNARAIGGGQTRSCGTCADTAPRGSSAGNRCVPRGGRRWEGCRRCGGWAGRSAAAAAAAAAAEAAAAAAAPPPPPPPPGGIPSVRCGW
ncbi:hypothetical protein JKP88DRAFT_330807 [Tribonema minus]|uniref:Uncharacterized protein n=1 Tax=Tribonema minus TaxID=303371 RepID=A0A835YM89_9STRA|nr:hypothetical protein JKP88DRAFT_330807 [Tribonema minus]